MDTHSISMRNEWFIEKPYSYSSLDRGIVGKMDFINFINPSIVCNRP